jgi:hypothetical protein
MDQKQATHKEMDLRWCSPPLVASSRSPEVISLTACDLSCSCTAQRTSSEIVENAETSCPHSCPFSRPDAPRAMQMPSRDWLPRICRSALAGNRKSSTPASCPALLPLSFLASSLTSPSTLLDKREPTVTRLRVAPTFAFNIPVVIVPSSGSSFFLDPASLINFINKFHFQFRDE